MSIVGYARVSTADQSLAAQLDQLTAAGCERVFSEKLSGAAGAARPQLAGALQWVREGDVFLVCRLDRLARSVGELHSIVARLAEKNVAFRCLQQDAVNTETSEGRLMLNMLAAFAEFENHLRRERQAEGIAKAKAEGRYHRRKGKITVADLNQAAAENPDLSTADLCRKLGISRASFYRVMKGAGDAS